VPADVDAVEVRDRYLLPIQNIGLRALKHQIVELQNVALDALRVRGSWDPAEEELLPDLCGALDGAVEEAAGAGAAAAAELMGGGAPAPVITGRSTEMCRMMSGDLAERLRAALAGVADAGPREVTAEVSRVFRGWRAEDAERWVGAVVSAAYHDSLLGGLSSLGAAGVTGVPNGRICEQCPAGAGGAWDPAGDPPAGTVRPPARVDCHCTIAPVA
jgi:hypothetical protein